MQAETEPVPELKPEGGHLVFEAELGRLRPHLSDLVGPDAWLGERNRRIDPLSRSAVSVTLGRRSRPDGKGSVVAGPVAVEA